MRKEMIAKKILVVDDEAEACDILKDFLGKRGYRVTTALSGEEAINRVKEESPHIVLLDIKMPGMNGLETLKRIKEIDKKIIIIMVTVVEDNETGKKCIEWGADDYITKPISFEHLESLLMVRLLDIEIRDTEKN